MSSVFEPGVEQAYHVEYRTINTSLFRATPYDYYSKGYRVRHHRGFSCYEKYDKTRDARILCIACLTFNDIEKERCSRCGCALLK